MERSKSLFLCLFVFCISSWVLSVEGLTYNTFKVPEFKSVSSVSLRTTGKRTENGEAVHSIELTLPQGKPISIPVKSKEGLQTPDCLYTKSHGETVLEQKPCPKVEAFEGVYEQSKIFLGFVDQARTILKGIFEHEGKVYFVDPTFEHASNLKLENRLHLATGPMIIYSRVKVEETKNQTTLDLLLSTIEQQKKKRGIEQSIGPAKASVRFPAPPFPSGDCNQKRSLDVKVFLDHSFINRWKNEKSSFNDPFAPPQGNSWSDLTAFFTLYVGAMSKYIYEGSLGINMVFRGLEEHPNPNDVPWNPAGSINSRGRYKCPNDIEFLLEQFTNWCKGSGSGTCLSGRAGSLNHLITDCQRLFPGESGTVGLAWVGVICSSSNTGTCTYMPGRDGYQCSAHEMGHNFGAPHDFRDGNQDIMSYEHSKYDGFSDQSYDHMCNHLGSQGYRCLPKPSTESTCTPKCSGKTCGDDGCGGLCGSCKTGQQCQSGTCNTVVNTCVPNCMGTECGDDGCGGSCGTCPTGKTCNLSQRRCQSSGTTCTPDCKNKGCGVSDGCNGACGFACDLLSTFFGLKCDESTGFVCGKPGNQPPPPPPPACTPKCDGKTCGDDGCGGSCGSCGRGSTCNTITSQCSCVPQTSCQAQRKTCGTIFNGCGQETCGPDCTTTCTPNPNACQGKSCGFVSNGCDMVNCGGCSSTTEPQICFNNKCIKNDACAACAADATCENGRCKCRPGFIGGGLICMQFPSIGDSISPGSWESQSGSLRDWTLSSDGKIWSNINPSGDHNQPSLLRWTRSQSLLAATEVTVSINVLPKSSKSMGGIAIGLDGKKYISFVVANNQVLAHGGTTSESGPWFVLGDYATGEFKSSWISLAITLKQFDSSSVTLKATANGKNILKNCEQNCIGINITNYLPIRTPDYSGDMGLFNVIDRTDFSQLKISTSTTTVTTLASCVTNNAELKRQLSNAMNIDENLIQDLKNPCANQKKRGIEQAAVVTFTTVGPNPLSPSAIGPSLMASQIQSGGALASSAASLSITSIAPVQTALSAGATTASMTAVSQSSLAGGAAGGLGTGAIAGIVIAGVVGAAIVAVATVVAVKKLNESGNEQSEAKLDHIRFSDAPPSSNVTKPSHNTPKGGKDILMPAPGHHASITGRSPIQHTSN